MKKLANQVVAGLSHRIFSKSLKFSWCGNPNPQKE